VSSPG